MNDDEEINKDSIFNELPAIEVVKKCGEARMDIAQIQAILRPRMTSIELQILLRDLTIAGTNVYNAYAAGVAEADYIISNSLLTGTYEGGTDGANSAQAYRQEDIDRKVDKLLKDSFGLE